MSETPFFRLHEMRAIVKSFRFVTSPSRLQNLIVWRLSACCGLRVTEIRMLDLRHVIIDSPEPEIRITSDIVLKRGKPRSIPLRLALDPGTKTDLKAWKRVRQDMGAGPRDAFICRVRPGRGYNQRINRYSIDNRWKWALRNGGLSLDRLIQMQGIHKGRHNAGTWWFEDLKALMTQKLMGHADLRTTMRYAHLNPRDEHRVLDILREET